MNEEREQRGSTQRGIYLGKRIGNGCHVKAKRLQKKRNVADLRASWQLSKESALSPAPFTFIQRSLKKGEEKKKRKLKKEKLS